MPGHKRSVSQAAGRSLRILNSNNTMSETGGYKLNVSMKYAHKQLGCYPRTRTGPLFRKQKS